MSHCAECPLSAVFVLHLLAGLFIQTPRETPETRVYSICTTPRAQSHNNQGANLGKTSQKNKQIESACVLSFNGFPEYTGIHKGRINPKYKA